MTRETVKIPVNPSLNIERYSGASIVTTSSLSTNIVYDNYPEGILYATQRPSINIIEDASAQSVGAKGRAIHYWSSQNKLYIVNDDTVHINSYSAGSTLTITSGLGRCYFTEVGSYLLLIDVENNEGWVISSADIILKMTGSGTWSAESGTPAYNFSGFPADLGNTLAHGAVTLDGTGYVLSTNSEISGCDIENPLQWDTLNVITAEKEPDTGVFIGKIHDNIVVLGTKTIELFWDAANTTNSPLSSRDDISYNMGCTDGKSVWIESDILYFIGASNSGEIGAYRLAGFKPEKISTPSTDSFFTTAKTVDSMDLLGSGFSSGGKTYYICTLYEGGSTITPRETLVFNARSKSWTAWEHSYPEIDQFPLVGWTISTTTTKGISGKGLLSNGDYISLLDDFNPQDSTNALVYVEGTTSVVGTDLAFTAATSTISSTSTDLSVFSDGDEIDVAGSTSNDGSYIISGTPSSTAMVVTTSLTDEAASASITITRDLYVSTGYITSTGAVGTQIPFTIRLGHLDFGTRNNKIGHKLRFIGDKTSNSQTLSVKWSDGNHSSFGANRTIDLSNPNHTISRLGTFRSRTFELSGTFDEQVRIEGLEFEIGKGNL